MVKDAGRTADKQVRRALSSVEDYQAGISNPQRDPAKAALASNAKRVAKLQESIAKQTWEKAMSKVTQADWTAATLRVGPARYSDGVDAARGKVADFWNKATPKFQQIQNEINALPNATEADREKRMLENLKRMRAMKGTL